MSSGSMDDVGITVKVNTEKLEKMLNELDFANVNLVELRQIVQDHLVVTIVTAGPKGICFPGREEDEERDVL